MALQPIPALTSLPADGTKPETIGALGISNSSGVRVLSKCTAGSGEAYLGRYEPETESWWPYGEYAPMKPDSAKFDGKFSGRYALERTGPVYFVLIAGTGVTLSADMEVNQHWIEGVQL